MELDRIVPCNIMSGGPEDLNLIELLWKQDVDLGVGKEVYDPSLREELERQRERESIQQQEKLKAQVTAREKEEKSRQEEASRWLDQNFTRDGETGEWVKRQNKTRITEGAGSVDDEFLTLEAALDYISNDIQSNSEDVVPEFPTFQDLVQDTNLQGMQPMLSTPDMHQLSSVGGMLSPDTNLEDEWKEVEEYLNISLSTPVAVQEEAAPLVQTFNSSQDMDLPQLVEENIFTSADLPLIQDANLPPSDVDESVTELGGISLTNASMPPQPVVMNTSLDWEVGNMTIFGNLTALPQDNVDDIDLQNMDDIFNTMSTSSDLLIASNTNMNTMVVSGNQDEPAASFTATSFSDDFTSAFDGLEGATGGVDFTGQEGYDTPYRKISRLSESSSDSGFSGKGGFSSSSSSSSSYYAGSPVDSTMMHNSTNSNDTEHDPHGTKALANQVAHNHTYNTLPGHVPREVKKYAPKENTKKGPHCRDEKRAKEMKIPFSVQEIVDSPVETFNDILTKYSLTEEQLTLIRDIRRRGKNKMAAQNCRKRKVGVIVTLSDEMLELQKVRDRLKAEREEMERETRRMRDKFSHLYSHIFQSLRDEQGKPYDHNLYSLQQSSDGNIFLVPRNVTNNSTGSNNYDGHGSTGDHNNNLDCIKKRKSDKN